VRFANWVKRFPLVAYFVLVFGIVWGLFLTISPRVSPMIAIVIGSWAPNGVGLLVTGVAEGRAGLRGLLGRVVRWRIDIKWYAIALLAPVAMAIVAIGLYVLLGNRAPDLAPGTQLLPILLGAVLTGAMGEELGWRGTALPLLQARWNALVSSLVLGVLWGLYHVPAILLSGTVQQGAPLIPIMVVALGLTVLVSWTFNCTGGSLIPVFLYRCSFNFVGNAAGIFGVREIVWVLAGVVGVAAAATVTLGWTRFTRPAAPPSKGDRLHCE
jgi:membrane protease YdiL (CAAX protease family)